MDYLDHMKARLEGKDPFLPTWLVENKSGTRLFAEHVGVNIPNILYHGPIEAAPLDDYQRFVLKPDFASTSIGVLLLEKEPGGCFRELTNGEVMDRNAVLHQCREVSLRFLGEETVKEGGFIMEEILVGADGTIPPPDIRCFAFQGDIGLIVMENHLPAPTRSMYFDGNFHPIIEVETKYSVDPRVSHLEEIVEAVPPPTASDILAVARRISVAVPSSFCRIDLYATTKGIHLGELTFYPGTFYYRNRKLMSASESARLGALWDRAESALGGTTFTGPNK